MDILIKNIEIPKEEDLHITLAIEGFVMEKIGRFNHVTTGWKEVPSHGDLIDAKELSLKIISKNFDSYEEKLNWVMDCIRNATTVLEATE